MTKAGKIITKILTEAPERYQIDNIAEKTTKQFQKLIPNTVPDIIKEDLAYYFNFLREDRSEESMKKWENATGCTDSPNSWKTEGYRPIFSFMYYDRITEGMFLALILQGIEPILGDQIMEMSIEEFNRQCRLTIVNYKPEIDMIDLKILQALSKEPTLVVKELANKTEHSYVAVYQHLQKMKEKLGLRILTRINYGELGIQPVYLITNSKDSFRPFKQFKTFLDGQATFLWGKIKYLNYYFINAPAYKHMLEVYDQCREEGMDITLLRLKKTGIHNWSFDNYNHKEQRWGFDFIRGYKSFYSSKTRPYSHKELFLEEYPKKEPYSLTPLEKRIIDDIVGKYDMTQKELAEQLGMHAQNLSAIKLKLQKDNIIFPRFEIRNFQPILCFMWCQGTNKRVIESIVAILQELPFSNISPVENQSSPDKLELIIYLYIDDLLYRGLAALLMQLVNEKKLDDFQVGLMIEGYFGMVKAVNILPKE